MQEMQALQGSQISCDVAIMAWSPFTFSPGSTDPMGAISSLAAFTVGSRASTS